MASRLAVSLAVCLAHSLPPAFALRPESHNDAPSAAKDQRGGMPVHAVQVEYAGFTSPSLVEISTLDGILIAAEKASDFGTGIEPEAASGEAEKEAMKFHADAERPAVSVTAKNNTVEIHKNARQESAHRRARGKGRVVAALEADANEVSTADTLQEADAKLDSEFLPALACVENPQGQRIGCKGACACMWWESCYKMRATEKPFEDTGVCEMSMKVMAGVAVVVSVALLLITLSSRTILQERDFVHALTARNLGARTMRDSLYAMHGKAIAQSMAAKARKRASM